MFNLVGVFILNLMATVAFCQSNVLVIGRTTGYIQLDRQTTVQSFGFSQSLSEALNYPPQQINIEVGDTVTIDFWNISQGQNQTLKAHGILFEPTKETQSKLDGIEHMDHGYYKVHSTQPGTYIYYSNTEYPFNQRVGMFGLIHIYDKKSSELPSTTWCSFEIDTTWHHSNLLNFEYTSRFDEKILPQFKPQYFLINGKQGKKLSQEKLHLSLENKPTQIIHLANTGTCYHNITFPHLVEIDLTWTSDSLIQLDAIQNRICLPPMSTCHIKVNGKLKGKAMIKYEFESPESREILTSQTIPITIKK